MWHGPVENRIMGICWLKRIIDLVNLCGINYLTFSNIGDN